MKKIIISVILILIALSAFIIGFGFFPIASVSGEKILYRDLQFYVNAGEAFKQKTNNEDPLIPGIILKGGDSRQSMLMELIVREIIKKSASEFGAGAVEKETKENLNLLLSRIDSKKLETTARQLYHIGYNEFAERVMAPQIREIVVRKRVEASGGEYGAWLEKAIKDSQVKIYFLQYRWTGNGLENK